ncbi:unnamed protein product, partial [Prorocentrum cordatum]
ASSGNASPRMEQWRAVLRSRAAAQSEVDLPARRQKMEGAEVPIERLQFGAKRSELWTDGIADTSENIKLEVLVAHGMDTILADMVQPTTVKNYAGTLSARESDWARAAKLYGKHDVETTNAFQTIVMRTRVRVAEAIMLMSLKEFADRPMKLKRLLNIEREQLQEAGWWEEVFIGLRARVDEAAKWVRKAGTSA